MNDVQMMMWGWSDRAWWVIVHFLYNCTYTKSNKYSSSQIISWELKGLICHFNEWLMRPFKSEVTKWRLTSREIKQRPSLGSVSRKSTFSIVKILPDGKFFCQNLFWEQWHTWHTSSGQTFLYPRHRSKFTMVYLENSYLQSTIFAWNTAYLTL